MLSIYDLSIEERDQWMNNLNPDQQLFLNESMKRGRRTVFARVMASQKGSNIPDDATFEEIERLVDDWIYVNYIDAGAVTDELKCECGRSLRYQHTVQNKTTGVTHKFGITHLELHTGIDAKVVSQILNGFQSIDFELNEILHKINHNWNVENAIGYMPELFKFPDDVQCHLDLKLPLLDRQINRVRRLIRIHQYGVSPASAKLGKSKESNSSDVVFEGNQAVLNLFEEVTPSISPINHSSVVYGVDSLELSQAFKNHVLHYLKTGVSSSLVICEMLIKEQGTSDKRFSTGKPDIYAPVCIYLDELVADGTCQLVDKDPYDRTYRLL